MRKYLFFILIVTACQQSSEEKMHSEINKYVNVNFHDPKSFEFISLKINDTSYVKDEIGFLTTKIVTDGYLIGQTEKQFPVLDKIIKLSKYLGDSYEVESSEKEKTDYLKKIEDYKVEMEVYQDKINELQKLDSNRIYQINTKCDYRARNKVGALNLSSAIITFNDSLRLINFDDSGND